jgi:Low affinity iron permease
VDTKESSAPHAHPSIEDHDNTVEAHYSGLERLRPHACYEGVVYIGHLVDGDDGEEAEVIEAVPCRRCTDSR